MPLIAINIAINLFLNYFFNLQSKFIEVNIVSNRQANPTTVLQLISKYRKHIVVNLCRMLSAINISGLSHYIKVPEHNAPNYTASEVAQITDKSDKDLVVRDRALHGLKVSSKLECGDL